MFAKSFFQEKVKAVFSELAIDISEREIQSLANQLANQSPGKILLKIYSECQKSGHQKLDLSKKSKNFCLKVTHDRQ